MEVKLDDEAIAEAVKQAILALITDEKREELITRAVESLLKVDIELGYGKDMRKTSHIQLAFETAVHRYAVEVIKKQLETDKYGKLINDIVEEAFVKIANEERSTVVQEIVDGISTAFMKGFKAHY